MVGREREGQVKIRCVTVSNFRSLQTFQVLEEDYQKQDQVALYEDRPCA